MCVFKTYCDKECFFSFSRGITWVSVVTNLSVVLFTRESCVKGQQHCLNSTTRFFWSSGYRRTVPFRFSCRHYQHGKCSNPEEAGASCLHSHRRSVYLSWLISTDLYFHNNETYTVWDMSNKRASYLCVTLYIKHAASSCKVQRKAHKKTTERFSFYTLFISTLASH